MPQPMTDVPITFTAANGDVVHAPMIEAVVGGVATKLVVDTGASDHLLTIELAQHIGLQLEPTDPGTDVTGASVESWNAGDVPLSLPAGGVVTALHDVIVFDGPPPFGRWGIGGIVSPQRLHPSGVVVLDLDRDVLTIGDTADTAGEPAGSWIAADVQRHRGGLLCVDAAVAPFSPCSMFLDSGAGDTDVDRNAVPGSADDVLGHPLLVVAGVAFPLDALHVSDEIPPPEGSTDTEAPHGLIGMDVMKGTVLVIPPSDGAQQVQWFVRSPSANATP